MEGEPFLGKFGKYTMYDDNEYRLFLKRVKAKGLELISDVNEVPTGINSLKHILPDEAHQINASHLTVVRKGVTRSKVEDKAMEDETLSTVKNFISERLKSPVGIFPDRTMYENKISIMEWDGVLVCDDKSNLNIN